MELTLGQKRTIEESTQAWRMLISSVTGSLSAVPEDFSQKIDAMDEEYKKAFGDYYSKAIEANDERTADELAADFDDIWSESHPGFYDLRAIFSDYGEDVQKEAEDAIRYVEENYMAH